MSETNYGNYLFYFLFIYCYFYMLKIIFRVQQEQQLLMGEVDDD